MPSATLAAAAILTEMTVVWRRPYRASKVVSGSMTNPSRLPQHGALLGDDTLDRELDATDANGAADGELGRAEQLLGHVEAEHRHEPPLSLVHVRERRPGGEVVVLHHHERRRDAEDEDVTHRAVPPLHVRHRGRPPGLQGDR